MLGQDRRRAARDKGAPALIARAPKLKTTDKRPDMVYKAIGAWVARAP
jgi:hypothetical protein